jgi:competence protein ComGC
LSVPPLDYLSTRVVRRRGFSLIELLLVMLIIMTLLALMLSFVGKGKRIASGTVCLSNLRSISQAFAFFTVDHGGRYPDPAANNQPWEESVVPYFPPVTSGPSSFFKCPADGELFPVIGSSYDWRDTGIPSTTMAGRSVMDVTRPSAALVYDALPGWHAPGKINVGTADGSVMLISQDDWFHDLSTPIRP